MSASAIPPHHLPGDRIAGLGTAGMFVIAALRLWAGERAGRPLKVTWRDGFEAAGLDLAAQVDWDVLLAILNNAPAGPLVVSGMHDPRLCVDECAMLRLLEAFQRGDVAWGATLLVRRLDLDIAGDALPRARNLARALDGVGLGLTSPGRERVRMRDHGRFVGPPVTAVTLH